MLEDEERAYCCIGTFYREFPCLYFLCPAVPKEIQAAVVVVGAFNGFPRNSQQRMHVRDSPFRIDPGGRQLKVVKMKAEASFVDNCRILSVNNFLFRVYERIT